EGDRTPDLMTASHALSQLSYGPNLKLQRNLRKVRSRVACAAEVVKQGELLFPHQSDAGTAADHLPLNAGLRFSRNAFTPSSLSSVAKQSANKSTSRRKPSSRFEREASFTASLAKLTAIGPFSAMRLAISIVFASSWPAGTT